MADNSTMAEHHASVTVNAPVHQVYGLFTHFNDFPKFMSFVKEVTYYDDQRSHWVAEVIGRHEWDAVNENWVEDQQLGWRSTNGLENFGKVAFQPLGSNQTLVDVFINYNPPAGVLGDVGENLGAGSRFDSVLQHDLDNFARMVDQAPPGALDPTSSNYLFHGDSAAAKGATTDRQNQTMNESPMVGSSNYSPGTTPSSDYASGAGTGYSTGMVGGTDYTTGTTSSTGTGSSDYSTGSSRTDYPSSSSTGSSTGSGYTSGSDYPASGNTGYTSGSDYPASGNTDYTSGSDYPASGNTGYTSDRPILDQDIISGQYDTGARTSNPVMPPDTGTAQPVMPPERDPDTNY